MAALSDPLAMAVEFLVPRLARPLLEKSMKRILQVVENLGPDDFRDKVNIKHLVNSAILGCYRALISEITWMCFTFL